MMLICTCLILIVGCASPRKYKESPFTKQSQQEDSVFNIGYGRKWLQDHGIIQQQISTFPYFLVVYHETFLFIHSPFVPQGGGNPKAALTQWRVTFGKIKLFRIFGELNANVVVCLIDELFNYLIVILLLWHTHVSPM